MLDFEEIKEIIQDTLNKSIREQEHQVALVASNPVAQLTDVKLEVGRLYGMGDITIALMRNLEKAREENS